MPHFLNFTSFQALPFYNRSDFNALCGAYNGGGPELCETTLAGALWNFPGSRSVLWHQDKSDDGFYADASEVAGTLTTAIASRQLPADCGWVKLQPLTHAAGEWSHLTKSAEPRPGEPEPVTIPLKKGEMLIFGDTVKHTVTPNPTTTERGIAYVLYGRRSWTDTPWHADTPLVGTERRGYEWAEVGTRHDIEPLEYV